jgi:hypothetical protein
MKTLQKLASSNVGDLFVIKGKPYELCGIFKNCGKNHNQTGYELHGTEKAKRAFAKHNGFSGFNLDKFGSLFVDSSGNEI